jgi:hypothetical protein
MCSFTNFFLKRLEPGISEKFRFVQLLLKTLKTEALLAVVVKTIFSPGGLSSRRRQKIV